MVQVPMWWAVLSILINGIVVGVLLGFLAKGRYPRLRSPNSSFDDVVALLVHGIGLALWLYWVTR